MADLTDDIPEARRDTLSPSVAPPVAKPKSSAVPWLLLLATAVLGLGGLGIFSWLKSGPPLAQTATDTAITSTPGTADVSTAPPPGVAIASQSTDPGSATPELPTPGQTASVGGASPTNSLLGHRPYDVADTGGLVALSTNGLVLLHPEVAQKVETMIAEARAVGIGLDVISGFRSLEDQQYLFFDLKAERGQTPETRAEVSAPPGYSEHHTGYAVDFIDADQPATDLSSAFDTTQAFLWLNENAAYYGFEMSFPKGNDQNVTYEPWHWRYVGNQESLELFYQGQP